MDLELVIALVSGVILALVISGAALIITINLTRQNKFLSTDQRTGLRRIELINRDQRQKGEAYLLVSDIDGFDRVNEQAGTEKANILLRQVAQAMRGALRATDQIYRWSGDTFVAVVNTSDVSAVARKVLEAVRGSCSYKVGEEERQITVRLVVIRITPDSDLESLVNQKACGILEQMTQEGLHDQVIYEWES